MSESSSGGSIRDFFNQNPQITIGIAALLVVVALYFAFSSLFGGGIEQPPAFFSNDDGATFYTDDVTKIPPFSSGGGTAYRAMVVRPREGTEADRYVKYLISVKEEFRERTADALANDQRPPAGGLLYKAPGESEWLDPENPEHAAAVAKLRALRDEEGNVLVAIRPKIGD
ncbi:MAG: hypothetical protein AAGD32_06340 [Planctomycetota bacterium]